MVREISIQWVMSNVGYYDQGIGTVVSMSVGDEIMSILISMITQESWLRMTKCCSQIHPKLLLASS